MGFDDEHARCRGGHVRPWTWMKDKQRVLWVFCLFFLNNSLVFQFKPGSISPAVGRWLPSGSVIPRGGKDAQPYPSCTTWEAVLFLFCRILVQTHNERTNKKQNQTNNQLEMTGRNTGLACWLLRQWQGPLAVAGLEGLVWGLRLGGHALPLPWFYFSWMVLGALEDSVMPTGLNQ